MGSLNLSLGGLGRGVGGRSRQVRGEPTGVVQSCCEGHFGGRVDGPHPWPVPPCDVMGLGCTSSQKQSLVFSGSLSHLFSLLLYLCSLLSKLLSLCFCFCLRTEANTTQSWGGMQKRGAILPPPRGAMDYSGKSKGPFWKLVCWDPDCSLGPLPPVSLSASRWAIWMAHVFLCSFSNHCLSQSLSPWGHRGNPNSLRDLSRPLWDLKRKWMGQWDVWG